eukprot:1936236-Amphidinium_carterae.3
MVLSAEVRAVDCGSPKGAMRKRLQQFVQQYLYQSFQFYEHEMSLFPYYTGVLPGQNRNRELRDLGSRLMRQK